MDFCMCFLLFFSSTQKFRCDIPSDAIIYLSFVYGNKDEHDDRTVLSVDEIKKRWNKSIEEKVDTVKVTDPNIKPLYREFRTDVLRRYSSLFYFF